MRNGVNMLVCSYIFVNKNENVKARPECDRKAVNIENIKSKRKTFLDIKSSNHFKWKKT